MTSDAGWCEPLIFDELVFDTLLANFDDVNFTRYQACLQNTLSNTWMV